MKSLPICNCLSGLCFSIFPNLSKSCISLSHTYLKDQSRITPRRIIRAPFLHVPYYYPTHYISCQFSTIQHAIKQGALYSLSLYLRQRWIQFCYLHSQALWLATFALDYYTISLSFLFYLGQSIPKFLFLLSHNFDNTHFRYCSYMFSPKSDGPI